MMGEGRISVVKAQVTATRSTKSRVQGSATPVTRADQIAEGLWELDQVFSDPGCFDTFTAQEAAQTLASEMVGAWRDEEILNRLEKFSEAEGAGRIKEAARHLSFVRRKLKERWGIVGLRSVPL